MIPSGKIAELNAACATQSREEENRVIGIPNPIKNIQYFCNEDFLAAKGTP